MDCMWNIMHNESLVPFKKMLLPWLWFMEIIAVSITNQKLIEKFEWSVCERERAARERQRKCVNCWIKMVDFLLFKNQRNVLNGYKMLFGERPF